METITTHEKETRDLARAILREVSERGSERARVIALSGDLGSGKTAFVRGLAHAMGVEERVTSPTFVIERRYGTPHRSFSLLIHIDAYRLSSVDELKELHWERDMKRPGTLVCVEWPEHVPSLIPPDALTVTFTSLSETERLITTSVHVKEK